MQIGTRCFYTVYLSRSASDGPIEHVYGKRLGHCSCRPGHTGPWGTPSATWWWAYFSLTGLDGYSGVRPPIAFSAGIGPGTLKVDVRGALAMPLTMAMSFWVWGVGIHANQVSAGFSKLDGSEKPDSSGAGLYHSSPSADPRWPN